MSSLVDAVINSDKVGPDLAATATKEKPSTGRNRNAPRSSPRPYGPPSESNGHLSDAEGFPDDEVVGVRGSNRNRPRNPMDRAIPRVVDEVGEKVAEEFQRFMEQYVLRAKGLDGSLR